VPRIMLMLPPFSSMIDHHQPSVINSEDGLSGPKIALSRQNHHALPSHVPAVSSFP